MQASLMVAVLLGASPLDPIAKEYETKVEAARNEYDKVVAKAHQDYVAKIKSAQRSATRTRQVESIVELQKALDLAEQRGPVKEPLTTRLSGTRYDWRMGERSLRKFLSFELIGDDLFLKWSDQEKALKTSIVDQRTLRTKLDTGVDVEFVFSPSLGNLMAIYSDGTFRNGVLEK